MNIDLNYIKELVAYSAHFIFENCTDFHKKLHEFSKYDFTKFKYKLKYNKTIKLTDELSYLANTSTYAISESDRLEFEFTYNIVSDLFVMYVKDLSNNKLLANDALDIRELKMNGYTYNLLNCLMQNNLMSELKNIKEFIVDCTGNNNTRDNWDPINGSKDIPVL